MVLVTPNGSRLTAACATWSLVVAAMCDGTSNRVQQASVDETTPDREELPQIVNSPKLFHQGGIKQAPGRGEQNDPSGVTTWEGC